MPLKYFIWNIKCIFAQPYTLCSSPLMSHLTPRGQKLCSIQTQFSTNFNARTQLKYHRKSLKARERICQLYSMSIQLAFIWDITFLQKPKSFYPTSRFSLGRAPHAKTIKIYSFSSLTKKISVPVISIITTHRELSVLFSQCSPYWKSCGEVEIFVVSLC